MKTIGTRGHMFNSPPAEGTQGGVPSDVLDPECCQEI